MTKRQHISITCDVGLPDDPYGCEEYYAAAWQTVTDLREEAARQGWTHKRGKDFCSQHSKTPSDHA